MITVPVATLSEQGDDGKPMTPEVGDTVDLGGAKALVRSIDGENASIDIKEINGQPVDCGEGQADTPDEMETDGDDAAGLSPEGRSLLRKAGAVDHQSGY